MTGFGRGEATVGPFRAAVEVRSVNHRFADLRVKLPVEISGLEQVLHQRAQNRVGRGRLDINVSIARSSDEAPPIEINRPLVVSYIRAAQHLKNDFNLTGDVTVQAVLALPDALKNRGSSGPLSPQEQQGLLVAFDMAMAAHESMRVEEGRILARDINRRIATLKRLQDRIAKRAPRMLPLYVRRLKSRIKDLNGSRGREGLAIDVDESRLAQEVAMVAERSDITEELVRLAGYLEQIEGLLGDPKEPVGKKLDFIMQEMNREANTINSKAIDLGICQDAIEVKAEVEKIREQVQNIE